jgi:hypothetical protein
VVLLFSDGLDDGIEKLEQKSDELRKEGTECGGWAGTGLSVSLFK